MRPATTCPRIAAALATLLLAACASDEDPSPGGPDGTGSGSLEDRLGALDGVRGVTAGETEVDQDLFRVRAVVDLEDDASAEEVTTVLETVAAAEPYEVRVYSAQGDSEFRDAPVFDGVSAISADGAEAPRIDPAPTARLFVAGLALVGGEGPDGTLVAVTVAASGAPSLSLLVPGARPRDLADLRRVVAGDDLLGAEEVEVAAAP